MTSLGELREALDKIDNEIAELYEKRMEVCRKVGEYKVKSGKKVFDTTQRWAKVPSQELSDALVEMFKDQLKPDK